MLFSVFYKIMVNNITFAGFRGAIALIWLLDPSAIESLAIILASVWNLQNVMSNSWLTDSHSCNNWVTVLTRVAKGVQ